MGGSRGPGVGPARPAQPRQGHAARSRHAFQQPTIGLRYRARAAAPTLGGGSQEAPRLGAGLTGAWKAVESLTQPVDQRAPRAGRFHRFPPWYCLIRWRSPYSTSRIALTRSAGLPLAPRRAADSWRFLTPICANLGRASWSASSPPEKPHAANGNSTRTSRDR